MSPSLYGDSFSEFRCEEHVHSDTLVFSWCATMGKSRYKLLSPRITHMLSSVSGEFLQIYLLHSDKFYMWKTFQESTGQLQVKPELVSPSHLPTFVYHENYFHFFRSFVRVRHRSR